MRKPIVILVTLALLLLQGTAQADEAAGEFDYWVLAMTWSPQYCADHSTEPQCMRQYDFLVHGLWPQYENGYPDFCGGGGTLDHDLVERMLPLMPSPKSVHHQWRKHGSCSGLPAGEYFLTVERARRAIAVPAPYREPNKFQPTSVSEIEELFLAANPKLTREAMAVQCSGRWLKEVRFCFDKDFGYRACGEDVQDKCGEKVVVRPMREIGPRRR